jgi:transcriptional regulator with XRE-family HTH domain
MPTPDVFIWTTSAELADAVLVAREAAGFSQAQLAARAGVSRRFLNQLEHGKSSLRVDKVIAVLAALSLAPLVVPKVVLEELR